MSHQHVFHGLWHVPEGVQRWSGESRMGTLTIEDDGSAKLEVYVILRKTPSFQTYNHYDVIWGDTADGIKITLFGASSIDDMNRPELFCVGYKISKVFMGAFLRTGNEPMFDFCVLKFPYLRNWSFDVNFGRTIRQEISQNNKTLLTVNLDNFLHLQILQHYDVLSNQFEQKTTQYSFVTLQAAGLLSMNHFFGLVGEISQFLSFALFSRQIPSEILLIRKGEGHFNKLIFKKNGFSVNPGNYALIPFKDLYDKIPVVMKTWHERYDQLSQICHYLLSAIQYDDFDAPDFLIVAQALDGFHKRFLNKRDGKDIKQYQRQIDLMLKRFEDVEAVQKCHIDSAVLANTRHKYTHLYPDEEDKDNVEKGYGLFRLTQKAKVLLTCCILELLGFSHREIDICFSSSVFNEVIDKIDWEDGDK